MSLFIVVFYIIHVCYRYAIIYEKGYQTTEEVVSAVTTKVQGIGYTDGTGIYENAGNRVWDSSDYVVPPQVWQSRPHDANEHLCILLFSVAQ